jgi:hypothetical protein
MLVEDTLRKGNAFSRFEYHMFYVLYPFVTCLLTLPRKYINYNNKFILKWMRKGKPPRKVSECISERMGYQLATHRRKPRLEVVY